VIELAIYDMDRTITRRATYTPFLIHAASRIAPWRLAFLPLSALAMLCYVLRLIDRKRLKEINHALLLGKVHGDALMPVANSFATRTVARNLLPGALPAIAADRAAGRRLVLATASYRFYVAPIAARLGFDDVVATNSIVGLDARIVPKIDGENNYGPAKLRMIEAWMAMEGIDRAKAHIRFYSDHASDAPVLEWADEAFAVNPHRKLRRLSRRRGWPLLDWS
jgi:HAD superfamily hydrolase (TIGR01490 family)